MAVGKSASSYTCSGGYPSPFSFGLTPSQGIAGRLVQHSDGSLETMPKSPAWVLGERLAPLVRKCTEAVGSMYHLFQKGVDWLPSLLPCAEGKILDRSGIPSPFPLSSLNGKNGVIFEGANPRDGAGSGMVMADFNGDGLSDLATAAPNCGPGTIYVVYGRRDLLPSPFPLDALDGTRGVKILLDEAMADEDHAINMVAGDVNGDGIPDLVVGVPVYSLYPSRHAPRVYIVYGSTSWPSQLSLAQLDGENGATIEGAILRDERLGASMATGQFSRRNANCDDVVMNIGTIYPATSVRVGYMIFGAKDLPASLSLSALTPDRGLMISYADKADMWSVIAAGNVTGRNFSDLIVGVPSTGKVHIIYGSERLPFNLSLAVNGTNGAIFASSPSFMRIATGDVDGNGLEDILVGRQATQDINVIYGNPQFPPVFGTEILDGKYGTRIVMDVQTYLNGGPVWTGDLDGDQIQDVFLGNPPIGPPLPNVSSLVYIVYGRRQFPSSFNISSVLDGQSGVLVQGENPKDFMGNTLAGGDFNGDGYGDLAIGADDAPSPGGPGKAYLIYGDKRSPSFSSLPLSESGGQRAP